jgi:tripartite-type tricarboxylate transporter receptor subunit TctC
MIRQIAAFVIAALPVIWNAKPVLAHAYPVKPVKLVVGNAAGSMPDVFGRLLAQRMSEDWRVQVYVENRPGAATIIAAETVAKAAPDGYTLLLADTSTWAINPHLFAKLPYHPLQDFVPVMQGATVPMFLVVNSSVPVSSTQELIAYASKFPGKLRYGTAGSGSVHHIGTELFKSIVGIELEHVPYKGSNQVATALLTGEVQMSFIGYANVASGVKSGKMKVLAIGAPQRSPQFPDLPTLDEAGVSGFAVYPVVGILAPGGTPLEIVAKVYETAAKAVSSKELISRLDGFGAIAASSSPQQFTALIKSDYENYARLVKLSGARIE